MLLSELSEASGVPIPTIKYYLREGLLDRGELAAANRATYAAAHLHRLRLIRALTEVGGLPLAAVRRVVAAVDDPARETHEVLGVAHRALAQPPADPAAEDVAAARSEVDDYLAGLGWEAGDDAPDRDQLAAALATLRRLGRTVDTSAFDQYASLAHQLAEFEVDQVRSGDRDQTAMVESAVIGTVIYERILVALRRLAQEDVSAQRHPPSGRS
jgi:DNA-binding transcriptional MerR regulator